MQSIKGETEDFDRYVVRVPDSEEIIRLVTAFDTKASWIELTLENAPSFDGISVRKQKFDKLRNGSKNVIRIYRDFDVFDLLNGVVVLQARRNAPST